MTMNNGYVQVNLAALVETLEEHLGAGTDVEDFLSDLGLELPEQEIEFKVTVTYRAARALTLGAVVVEEAIYEMVEMMLDDEDDATYDMKVEIDGLHRAPRKAAPRRAAVRKARRPVHVDIT